jgi:hypothetical protein
MTARLTIPGRPSFTANAARRIIARGCEWREAGAAFALDQGLLRFDGPVAITVEPRARSRPGFQVVARCAPAAKSAIEGLIDERVLPG